MLLKEQPQEKVSLFFPFSSSGSGSEEPRVRMGAKLKGKADTEVRGEGSSAEWEGKCDATLPC